MIGSPRLHLRLVDSTNERAKRLAADGAPHGTLVTAGEQSAGRGRQGRSWVAPPGSAVLMSLVVRGLEERHALLPLATAVAICEACEALAPVECRIKWPNDVWVERRKLAGILIEGRPQEGWAVVGIGLNVTTVPEELPAELRETATSLRAAAGDAAPPSAEAALPELLAALAARLGDEPGAILAAWRERDALLGSPVRWAGGEGTAAGVTDAGALVVETADGRVELDAGEVHLGRG
jgi:BirA family transcriptional regulator, biotin operon repressor / biotin---[acetyl-CoA-carboxylase] ligase